MNFKMHRQKTYQLIFLLFSFYLITSCGLYKKANVKDFPINEKDKRKKNVEEGRGMTIGNLKKGSGGNFEFATANEMWRATLDVLDFVPLATADYGGGIISTDWYSESNNLDESLKITVQFLTNEIRVDGLKVNIFKKNCDNNNCVVNKVDTQLNDELKMAILKKATRLKKDQFKKSREGKGEYKEPNS